MEMIIVDSTTLAAIGYDEMTAVLVLEFKKGGSIYEYYDVPQHEFDLLMAADSKGSYCNKNIFKIYRQQKIA